MKSFLKQFSAVFTSPSARPRDRLSFRPRIECLESRKTPTVNFTGEVLTITGTDQNDSVHIDENYQEERLTVTHNGSSMTFSNSRKIRTINVDLLWGSNSFDYDIVGNGPAVKFDERTFDIDSDGPFSSTNMNFSHNSSNAITLMGNLSIYLHTSDGRDDVDIQFGKLDQARVAVFTDLEGGDDGLVARFTGDLVKSRVELTIDAGSGDDRLIVWATTPSGGLSGDYIDIDKYSSLDVVMLGGGGNDYLEFQYRGVLHGSLNVVQDGGEGDDDLGVKLDYGTSSTGCWDTRLYGQAGIDRLCLVVERVGRALACSYGLLDGGADGDAYYTNRESVEVISCNVYDPGLRGLFYF
jgi:hypothetical protein